MKKSPPANSCLYGENCPCSVNQSTVTNTTFIFPLLYKKDKEGALMYWQIASRGFMINTEYGQVGTPKPQFTVESIEEGKNIGKVNETTPTEQAHNEARSRWEKKVKLGYTADREKAERGEDEIGVPKPMLAHNFEEHSKKIEFPCYASPKLDGLRCLAFVYKGAAFLYSRTRKEIKSAPHIQRELVEIIDTAGMEDMHVMLDGEIYNHKFRSNFETLMSIARKQEPDERHELLQLHVFDIVIEQKYEQSFRDRLTQLKYLLDEREPEFIRRVRQVPVEDRKHAEKLLKFYQEKGYEGLMLRNLHSEYVQSRSYDLQKYKGYIDEEFEIIDIKHGRGRMADCAIFVCVTPGREEFKTVMAATQEERRKYLEHKEKYIGNLLTVRFQEYTNKMIPLFPRGVRILK